MPRDGCVFEIIGLLLLREEPCILVQGSLIAFEGEDVVGALGEDLGGDVALTAHGVDGDDGAFDREHVEKLGNGGDFVRLGFGLHLPEHEAMIGGESRDDVDGGLTLALAGRAAQRFAINGDDAFGNADEAGGPGGEAALELLDVEGGENFAEPVVRRRAVLELGEALQQSEFGLAEPRDVDEVVRSREDRQETENQDFRQRIDHLARLSMVPQLLEIIEKNNVIENALGLGRNNPAHRLHRAPPMTNQRIATDSALCPLVTYFLHPIALH